MKNGKLHCYKSISILEKRCTEFFLKNNISSNPYFVDGVHDASALYSGDNKCDIVFFGGMIRRLWELSSWDFSNARLWVLSSTYQKILMSIFKVPKKNIGIIPRMELTGLPKKLENFPSKGESLNFVYSGRLSRTKNIELLLLVVSYLQTTLNEKVTLTLFGDYDDEINLNSRPMERIDYKSCIGDKVKKLSWKSKPIFKGEMKEDEWIKHCPRNSVLITLSTLLQEDFGVSVAQWNELGLPLIISDWGGHQDVSETNCLKIPPVLIPHYDGPTHLKEISAKHIAHIIADRNALNNISSQKIQIPKYISKKELNNQINLVKENIGSSTDHINKGEWELLGTEREGQNFINQIENCFTSVHRHNKVIVSNWFENNARTETEYVKNIVQQECKLGEDFCYLFFRDIHHSSVIKKIMLCEEILFPYYITEMEKWLKCFVDDFSIAGKITVILHPEQLELKSKIKSILRDTDSVIVHIP